jgi:hypothetical protein
MIGLVLAFVVTAILLSLFGFWIVGIPVAIVALVLFVLFLTGFGRRAAANKP